eukprot:m51a1_g5115 hypothetical protein (251) ;mRNA; r:353083-354129
MSCTESQPQQSSAERHAAASATNDGEQLRGTRDASRKRQQAPRPAEMFDCVATAAEVSQRGLRGSPMTVAVGTLSGSAGDADTAVFADGAGPLALAHEHSVLVVSMKQRRRGVCGLAVASASPADRSPGGPQALAWLFVAAGSPAAVEVPWEVWSAVVGALGRSRVLSEGTKNRVLSLLFDIPERIVCPLTRVTITEGMDAVSAPDGRVYGRRAIMHWLFRKMASPVTRQPMYISDLTPWPAPGPQRPHL